MARSSSPERGRRVVGASIAALVALLFVTGCADDTESTAGSSASTTVVAASGAKLVGPAAFEQRVATAGVVTINVHVPDEGSIAGTDLTIPYTDISTTTELPSDHTTPLAVYCRSGNMSASAVRDLISLGYTDVVELEGGMQAWTASGRKLLTP